MNKKYQIIYADPPWSYYNDSSTKQNCAAAATKWIPRPPYDVMSSAEIMKLPVGSIAADDAILFIWTTDYHLNKCMDVIKAWGFEYKTVAFSWLKKTKAGKPVCFMGAYTMKSGIEMCLLATRGKKAHSLVKKHNIRSLIESPRMEHSKKPDVARERIVELLGDIPRIELFARETSDGWHTWGNQVECDIELTTTCI